MSFREGFNLAFHNNLGMLDAGLVGFFIGAVLWALTIVGLMWIVAHAVSLAISVFRLYRR